MSVIVRPFNHLQSSLRDALSDAEFRGLLYIILVLLGIGTAFYYFVERWTLIDSFYFAVCTLTTLGYGDLYPTTEISKLFTTFYVIIGIIILFSFISKVIQHSTQRNGERLPRS